MGLIKKITRPHHSAGFTVIEVLIVLAIAGLMLLIVLMVIPQLRKNFRNRARTQDAGTVIAAVNACLSNYGDPQACKTPASLNIGPNDLQIFTEYKYYDPSNPTPGYEALFVDGPIWWFGAKCDPIVGVSPASSTKSFAVVYAYEGGAGLAARCIDG